MDTSRKRFVLPMPPKISEAPSICTADIERIRKIMEFQTLYGTSRVVVTAVNCGLFRNIPLLSARVIAAETRGKHLAIDALDGLIVLDHLPEPAKSQHINGMSVGFNSVVYDEAATLEPDTEPRNRAERRHGRQADKQIWQKKDWRIRK